MNKRISKIIATALAVTMMVSITVPAFAKEETVDNTTAVLSIEEVQDFLSERGFSQDDFRILENDVWEIYNIIQDGDMNQQEIDAVRKGFVESKPLLSEESEVEPLPVDENGNVYTENGDYVTTVPNKENPYEVNNAARLSGTGPHLITYTKPSYKFYKATAYVDLPNVSVDNNSRPYMMFGAYMQNSPYTGCDAGLVYYESQKGWTLFVNAINQNLAKNGTNTANLDPVYGKNGWYMRRATEASDEPSNVFNNSRVYLSMELVNGYVRVIVRDAATWTILDHMDVYMRSNFTSNPLNIELTRETSLAQHSRIDDGSSLSGAHWSQVYYYGTSGSTSAGVKSLAQYLQSSHASRFSYKSSLPCFLVGDTSADKNYISVTPISNYYEEIVNIKLQ